MRYTGTPYKEQVNICMLGGFSVEISGRVIVSTDAGGQVWNLMEYLVCNRYKALTQEQLIEILWNDETEDPAGALKNLVYRLRKSFLDAGVPFAKQLVLSSGGVYRWNNDIPCGVEVEEYEKACIAAQRETDLALRMQYARKAVDLYTGDFLPGAYHRSWVTPINSYYHTLYFKQVYALLAEYESAENWNELLTVATRAAEIDRFEEEAHRCILLALCRLGRQSQAASHYNKISDLFYRELSSDLSPKLREMFQEIAKSDRNGYADLMLLKEDLREEKAQGAYYCEYEVFKSMYQARVRSAVREGTSLMLGLMGITSATDQRLDNTTRTYAMHVLQRAVKESLRIGDIYSRCTATQYIILLPQVNFENGEKILARITKRFKRIYHSKKVKLICSLQPMDRLGNN
ncbi:MAG: BTAD domain-containing putative transcriptional regulator [Pygmaiobacter massiliensis]|nr:BTAD domain-containing putative transcriptional regulator [Pygmaiobacter massiliensis]